MGKAVVASEITGTIDILTTDPERQLYPAGDYKRAAQLARDLLEDRELLEAVAARSRETVVERFSADRTRDELVCAYEVAMRHHDPSTERRARFSAIGSRTP
jgi:glycosyltransferase involved in cell wall biosynthesis